MVSVQAVLALSRVDASTGGTAFWKGSHKLHRRIVPRKRLGWEYVGICKATQRRHGLVDAQPELDAGDILIWDSRTVHRAAPPAEPGTAKAVVYLSMVPASRVGASIRAARKEAFLNGVATTHWVTRFVDRGEGPAAQEARWAKVAGMV